MTSYTFSASNAEIEALRNALQRLWDADVFRSVVLDYAADQTLEALDEALATYEKKKQSLLEDHQRKDEDGFVYFTAHTGHEVRRKMSSGQMPVVEMKVSVDFPRTRQEFDGNVRPPSEDAEMQWRTVDELPLEPASFLSTLSYQFASEEERSAYQSAVGELQEIETEVTLSLVEEDVFLEEGAIDRSALREQGLFRLVRRLLVKGNQDYLEREKEAEAEDMAAE